MPLRGLYDPKKNHIKLFPEELQQEYGGQKMDELKGAKKELEKVWSGMKNEVKKGMSEAMGDGIKDLKKSMDELDAVADVLKNLGN